MVSWNYLPQSDADVVGALIKNRSKLDSAYYPKMTDSGVPDFSEDVVCTYADLDILISKAKLSKGERFVLDQMMAGYSLIDIANKYGSCAQSYRGMFNRAVEKLVQEHNENWYYVTHHAII